MNTTFAFFLFSILIAASQPGSQVLYLNIISSGISYISGYFLYKNFVWSKNKASLREFMRFVKSNLIFLALNLITLSIFVNELGFAPIVVQLFTTGFLVIISFLIHANWTFDQIEEVYEANNLTKAKDE